MKKYYEVYPIADDHHDIFDTISYVGYKAGMTFNDMLLALGFSSSMEMLMYNTMMVLDHYHFNLENFIANRLNRFCEAKNLRLRISAKPYLKQYDNKEAI